MTGCCHYKTKPNNIAINIGYGKETRFGDLNNIKENDNYNIKTFSVELIKDYKKWAKSLELSIIDHNYYVDNNYLNHSNSFSIKFWVIKKFSYENFDTFVGLGVGVGFTNPSRNNKYLANGKITSDLGFRVGLQRKFQYFSLRLEYMFRHFSAIWKDDRGENLDEVRFGIIFPIIFPLF